MSVWTEDNQRDSEIYNDGYSDGYDAGKADMLEQCKNALDNSVNLQTQWYSKGYADGQADCLENLVKLINTHIHAWFSDDLEIQDHINQTVEQYKRSIENERNL